MEPGVQFHIHKEPPRIPILCRISPIPRIDNYFFKINSDIVLPHISFFPSFSLPDVLCDPTDLIWRKGTPFEAMTGRTAPSSDVS